MKKFTNQIKSWLPSFNRNRRHRVPSDEEDNDGLMSADIVSLQPFIFDANANLTPLQAGSLFLSHRATTAQYTAAQTGGYIQVSKLQSNCDDRPLEFEGWKIHISVEPTDDNLNEAWNLVMPILVRYGIPLFKVLPPAVQTGRQPGKEIVVYACNARLDMPWQAVLQEIHNAFSRADIKPGEPPNVRIGDRIFFNIHETNIPGSLYFYVRDDAQTNVQHLTQHRQGLGPLFSHITIQNQSRVTMQP